MLLNPNALSTDGTVALGPIAFPDDGRLMAYALSSAGSDWQEWRVRDVATGRDLPDLLKWSKFSGASWLKDGSGFYYGRYEAPKDGNLLQAVNKNQKLCFHAVGAPQETDALVYERPDRPDWMFGAEVTDDGRYLLVTQTEGTENKNRIFVRDLEDPGGRIEPFLDQFDFATGKATRLWRSEAPYFEAPVALVDPARGILLALRESVTDPPNYVISDLRRKTVRQLTSFADPAPEFAGVTRELITYQRADGVQLSATLYLPPAHAEELQQGYVHHTGDTLCRTTLLITSGAYFLGSLSRHWETLVLNINSADCVMVAFFSTASLSLSYHTIKWSNIMDRLCASIAFNTPDQFMTHAAKPASAMRKPDTLSSERMSVSESFGLKM